MPVCPKALPAGSRIAVFGGSFNPPHIAHLAMANIVAEAASLDAVVWMPAAMSPHKQGDSSLESSEDRYAMVEAAIVGNDCFLLSDWEVKQGGVSFTVDTLRALKSEQPDSDLFLILGGDSLASFDSWKEPEEILALAELLVYERPGSTLEPVSDAVLARTTIVEAPRLDLSSTEIRDRIKQGKSVRYLTPDPVLAYITEQNLYSP